MIHLSSCRRGAVNSIDLSFTHMHRIGLSLEFQTLSRQVVAYLWNKEVRMNGCLLQTQHFRCSPAMSESSQYRRNVSGVLYAFVKI